jgi:hypothetical protein
MTAAGKLIPTCNIHQTPKQQWYLPDLCCCTLTAAPAKVLSVKGCDTSMQKVLKHHMPTATTNSNTPSTCCCEAGVWIAATAATQP